MSYSSISTKVSNYLAEELNYSEERKSIIAYSIDSILLTVIGFLAVMIVGWIIGIPKATFFAIICGDILRKFSGGAHFSTPFRCLATGAITYPLVTWIGLQANNLWGNETIFHIIIIVLLIGCFLSVMLYAPVDSPGKPIVSSSFRKKLKISSVVTAITISIIVIVLHDSYISVSMTAGLAIQSFTLLPFLKKER